MAWSPRHEPASASVRACGRALAALSLTLLLVSACGSPELPPGDGTGTTTVTNPEGNRGPVINPIPDQQLAEGETLRLDVVVTDPDNDTLYLETSNLPEGATFDPVQGQFRYDPEYDVVPTGEDSLVFADVTIAVDDNYLDAVAVFSITVTNSNRSPFFLSDDARTLNELELNVEPDMEVRIGFQVVDPDDDEIALRLTNSPAYARLSGLELILSPTEGDTSRVDEFSISATDQTVVVDLPVRVVVGTLEAELPAPRSLQQTGVDGNLNVGDSILEGLITFSAEAHNFEHSALRLAVEVAPVGEPYNSDATLTGTSLPVAAGAAPTVAMTLPGGEDYRWRARFLSDEFGAGPYTSFGNNADGTADLVVGIVPVTVLDGRPHNPSPRESLRFEFYSPNVRDFECSIDDFGEDETTWIWSSCNSIVECCPGDDCGERDDCEDGGCTCAVYDELLISEGMHVFRVRALTTEMLPDPSPESFDWIVIDEPNPPETTLTGSTCAPDGQSVYFTYSGNLSYVQFECALAGSIGCTNQSCDWMDCNETQCVEMDCRTGFNAVGLSAGQHTFVVRGISQTGRIDTTAESSAFTIPCN